MVDVFIDGGDQLRHAGEHAATQALGGDVAEESLDHVQPRRRGRCEVHVEARVFGQPLLHCRVLVRGVVVGDEVQRLALGRLAIDLAQELEPLDMRVALSALADDLAVKNVERGEQRGRAVALVVVRCAARVTWSSTPCGPGWRPWASRDQSA